MRQLASLCVISSVLYVALAGAAPAPRKQEHAPAPPVGELVATALAAAPSLQALEARLAASREMVAPAGALPDPTLALELQDMSFPKYTVGSDPMSMIGPQLSQEIPWPGKRAARRAAASADVATRAAELERLRRRLAAQVRTLYARLFALDREQVNLEAGREMLAMLEATAASRFAAGEDSQEAVLKAQLEESRLGERLDDVAARRAASAATLDRVLGRDSGEPIGEVTALDPVAPPPPPWPPLAAADAPEVAVRQAELAAAQRRSAVAHLDVKPDLMAGAGVGLRGGLDPSVTLSFGMTLPLWRKHKQAPLARAADLEVEAARADLRDAQVQASADAARLAAEWERATSQVERYRQAIVPQSAAAIDAARASYLTGSGDFLTVIDDFERWLDARIGLAAREGDRYAAWAEIEALVGALGKEK